MQRCDNCQGEFRTAELTNQSGTWEWVETKARTCPLCGHFMDGFAWCSQCDRAVVVDGHLDAAGIYDTCIELWGDSRVAAPLAEPQERRTVTNE